MSRRRWCAAVRFSAARRRLSGRRAGGRRARPCSKPRGVGRARSVRRHSSAAGLRRAIGAASLRELFAAHSVDQKPLSSTLGTALSSPNGSQRRSVHRGQGKFCATGVGFSAFGTTSAASYAPLDAVAGCFFERNRCSAGWASRSGHCACSGIEAAIRAVQNKRTF